MPALNSLLNRLHTIRHFVSNLNFKGVDTNNDGQPDVPVDTAASETAEVPSDVTSSRTKRLFFGLARKSSALH